VSSLDIDFVDRMRAQLAGLGLPSARVEAEIQRLVGDMSRDVTPADQLRAMAQRKGHFYE
jgi:hypothetical protein